MTSAHPWPRGARILAGAVILSASTAWAGGSSTGLIPINDLGTGTYMGFQGGLYPGGVNAPPAGHFQAAMARAQQIQPRNALGEVDFQNGVIVMIAIGMSNTNQEFAVFERDQDLNTGRNARVVVIDTAVGGQAASVIAPPNANYWTIVNQRLAAMGVTPAQVQVAWMKQANAGPPDNFPVHAQDLRDDLEAICNNLIDKFPNMRLCYVSSRTYGGYAQGTLNPEPQAYESGFSVKWLIEDQINGDPGLNYNADLGLVRSPLLLWGAYLWADGIVPRSDGLTWLVTDFEGDGTHPSPAGEQKVGDLLGAFFASAPTAQPWWRFRPGFMLRRVAASDDAYVRADAPAQNFGAEPVLRVIGGAMPAVTYLKFDRAAEPSLPGQALVAKLSLRNGQGGGGNAHPVTDTSWSEGSLTFGNAPPPGPALVVHPQSSREGTYSANITATYNGTPNSLLAFALTMQGGGQADYRSKEAGQPPRLILTVRTPATAGDLSGDCVVDSTDLNIVLSDFGCTPADGDCLGDVDFDGDTDTIDLNLLLSTFGNVCP